jgi:PAS domain S-box-containing protein
VGAGEGFEFQKTVSKDHGFNMNGMNRELKTGDGFKDGILREQVRLAMKQLPTMQAASFIVALVLCYAVRGIVSPANIFVWVFMVLAIVASRVVFYFRFLKVREELFAGDFWQNFYLILALVSGIIWGLSAFIIFPAGNLGLISLFVLVIASLSAATTVSHSSIRLAPTAWAGPAMLLYALRCVRAGGEVGYITSVLIVLYLFTILRYSLIHNGVITSAISLKFENLELLEHVRKGQEVLEKRVEERTLELRRANECLVTEIEERRLAEDSLRASEKKYRDLVQYANSVVLRWDTKGVITFVNEFAQEFFGYTEDELLGKNVMGTIVAKISQEGVDLENMIQDICRNPQAFERNQNENLCKNGDRVWVSWSNRPIFSKKGALVELLSIGQDMTERKRAEEALRESEKKYRLLAENVSDVIFTMDLNLKFTYVSPSAERMHGWTAEELQTFNLSDYMTPASSELVLEVLAAELALQGSAEADPNRVRTLEVEQYRKDGTTFWTEVAARFLYGNSSVPIGIFGATRDISERKRADKALRESEERFRLLFDGAADAFFLHDQDGRLVDVNRVACESLGYTREELLQMSVADIEVAYQPADLGALWERIGEGHGVTVEGVHRRRDGSTFPAEIHITPFALNERPLVFGAARDISERKRAEEALRAHEERLRLAMEASQQGWFDLNVQTGEVSVSPEYTRIIGYEPEEFTSNMQGWIDGIHPEDRNAVLKVYKECLETAKTRTMEYRRRTKTGEWKWIRSVGKIVGFDAEKKPLRMAGTHADISERKRVEEALLLEEQFSELLLDSLPGIFYLYDGDLRLRRWNRNHEIAMGFSAEELRARFIGDFFPSEDNRARILKGVRRVLDKGIPGAPMESTLAHRDGRLVPYILSGVRLDTPEGPMLMGVGIDISDRVKAELALRESEEKYRLITRCVPDLIWAMDLSYRFTYVSPSVERTHGYTVQEFLNLSMQDSLTAQSLFKASEVIAEELDRLQSPDADRSRVRTLETEEVRKDGSTFWAEVSGVFLWSDDGKPIGIIGMTRDITERKRAQEEMLRLRNYLSNIIDSMPSMLVGVDAEGRVTQWNAAAEGVTEISAAAIQGQRLSEILPSLCHVMENVQQAMHTKTVHSESKTPRLAGGKMRYEDITVYPLTGYGMDGAVIRIDDVTERVNIEEMIIQSEKMLSVGGLAAGMAHEINNPLGVILQASQNILRRVSPDLPANTRVAEECGTTLGVVRKYLLQREIPLFLEDIRNSGLRAAQIVENMLAFSRMSDVQGSSTDLADLLDRTVALAATDFDLKKGFDFREIEIVREYHPDVPLVICRASKIQQVFLNILRNGAEAMMETRESGRAPRFVLRVLRDESMARIDIEDNGPGMAEAMRRRVFEPFFTTKDPGEGIGLGLSVSYFIITEDHGGTLSVECAPGTGSRFIIRLPADGRKRSPGNLPSGWPMEG